MHKNVFFTFVDLEKAYDKVPRDLVYSSLRRRNVQEKPLRLRLKSGEDAEDMAWLADWDGEQGTKCQHREYGSDRQ